MSESTSGRARKLGLSKPIEMYQQTHRTKLNRETAARENKSEVEPRSLVSPEPLPGTGTPSPKDGECSLDWQTIIWREWRQAEDEVYARHLFDLVADEPVGYQATLMTILLGMLFGGLAGLFFDLLGTLGEWQVWGLFMGIGIVLGGAGGLLSRLLLERRLSWRVWLARLTFHMAPGDLGLLGIGVTFVLLGGLAGWVLGWQAGLGHIGGILALGILLAGGFGLKVVNWMIGFGREPNSTHANQYRTWWRWWRGRPNRTEVETALQLAYVRNPTAGQAWSKALQHLELQKKAPDSPKKMMIYLQSADWIERFTARHILVISGGEAVAHLQPIATKRSSPLWRTALGLLRSIGQETTARYDRDTRKPVCLKCLTRFGPHTVAVSGDETITYFGCRLCRQSRTFSVGTVVAVLDVEMNEEVEQTDVLRVNWLKRRTLFDFDRVEVGQATDEDVERFAVQVGNDTDPIRQPHYPQMQCVVGPRCELSGNTMRVLDRVFGRVIRK